jgi:hypothetical protein
VKDWVAWHEQYQADTPLTRRLAIVQRHIREALEACAPGPIRVISMCAGDGHDLVGALDGHRRRGDVMARLVELEPALVARGRGQVAASGLDGIELVQEDASNTSAYSGSVAADLLLVCGVFGNVGNEDILRTIGHLPELCAKGATVIWTRHRRPPDLTPAIRRWFARAGFAEVAFDTVPDSMASVGVHRLARAPRKFIPDVQLFAFIEKNA